MTTRDKIIAGITFLLALIGTLLSIAQDVKNIPGLGNYSNLAGTFIGFAIIAKQVLNVILDHLKPTTVAKLIVFLAICISLFSCQTSLEGLSKDQKFEIIKGRESRAGIWTTIGSGLAQGLGGAAVGWASAHSNSGSSSSKPLPNDNGLRK